MKIKRLMGWVIYLIKAILLKVEKKAVKNCGLLGFVCFGVVQKGKTFKMKRTKNTIYKM